MAYMEKAHFYGMERHISYYEPQKSYKTLEA